MVTTENAFRLGQELMRERIASEMDGSRRGGVNLLGAALDQYQRDGLAMGIRETMLVSADILEGEDVERAGQEGTGTIRHIEDPTGVEIQIAHDGNVWVNVDGRCVLRVVGARSVVVDDPMRGCDVVAPKELPADDGEG
jgi:hypothetical protein